MMQAIERSAKAIAATEKVNRLLALFYDGGNDGLGGVNETDVIDLLADVRHFCDDRGLDYAELDRAAYPLYRDERYPHYDSGESLAEMAQRDPTVKLTVANDEAEDLATNGEAVDGYNVLSDAVALFLARLRDTPEGAA